MSQRLSRNVPPLVTPRRLITVTLLLTSVVVILVAQASFGRPRMWRWAMTEEVVQTGEPTILKSSLPDGPSQAFLSELLRAVSYFAEAGDNIGSPGLACGASLTHESAEFVPLPEASLAKPARHAPYPDRKLLSGAADGEPFLIPSNDALPELQASAKALGDAQARYHLLQLAREAQPGSLEADGSKNVRYQALKQKPQDYRGELISVSGTLISIGAPFELQQKIPGLDFCYLGVLAADAPKQSYLLFFIDLPERLTKNQTDWQQLYLHDVQFTGYFYKVARFQENGKKEPWMLPVLVGKSLRLPAQTTATEGWFNIVTVFVVMALPVLTIAIFLPRFFQRREARHRQLMERFRSHRAAQDGLALEMDAPGNQPQ